ncbi:MAG: hypothetical protein AAB553_01490 [Patescibacteria group bacterium]
MTLHETVEISKKVSIGAGFAIVVIGVLVLLFRGGVAIKEILFPRKIQPPTFAYDVLPPLAFPPNVKEGNFTYTLNTIDGEFPVFPDRLNVFPIVQNEPNFLNLDKAKQKAAALGFVNRLGTVLPETPLGGVDYQWAEQGGLSRVFTIDIVNFDFDLTSRFLSSLTVLAAQDISNQQSAITSTTEFLGLITLFPDDIDLTKTSTPDPIENYVTYPELFDIQNGQLVPATSLSRTKVIRVNLYQKNIEYELITGKSDNANVMEKVEQKLPILYPNPPYSTMSFWVASGDSNPQVMESQFVYQEVTREPEVEASYAIKTPQEAFEELKQGKGYIASYKGDDGEILINNIFLAYYMGEDRQQYLMPIIVFEGDNGFFAYISAVRNDWIQ